MGDFNCVSQVVILWVYIGRWQEFQVDVVKVCYYGSDDVLYEFL